MSQTFVLKSFLSNELEEFDAYYLKFVTASFSHYEILFNLNFSDEPLAYSIYQNISNSNNIEDIQDISSVIEKTKHIYLEIIRQLEKKGDKTFYFVKCRLYELEMINDNFFACSNYYKEYFKFAERENDKLYEEYALTYLLKLNLVKMHSPQILAKHDNIKAIEKEVENLFNKYVVKISLYYLVSLPSWDESIHRN